MSYLRQHPGRRATPQSRPIPGSGQVENQAGGFVWEVDALTRLRRFLILGSEGNTYYATENEMMQGNVQALHDADPMDAIHLTVEVSQEGLAAKNDPAIFALAYYAGHTDPKVRQEALKHLGAVCRTATHLFHFCAFVEKNRGWGRSLRRAIGQWYASRSADSLAYQMVKYRQRDGYTHKDLLRLGHPAKVVSAGNPTLEITDEQARLFDWACGRTSPEDLPDMIEGYLQATEVAPNDDRAMAKLITKYELPREAVPTDFLTSKRVWAALLDIGMPMTALVRNLPTMTRVGLLTPMGGHTTEVVDQITNSDALQNARVHPLSLLTAHLTYAYGRSIRGSATWSPVREIIDALDEAFYLAFDNVEPTGKRHLLALDVSGSMNSGMVNGVPGLTPRVASSAMAMVTARSGDPYHIVGFTAKGGSRFGVAWRENTELTQLTFNPSRQRLQDICRATDGLPFGGTDCSLPMLYALGDRLEVDTFVIYTDAETWAGNIHASQALQMYREKMGIKARLVVVGMVSNGFTIADPNDAGMLDVVGFDSSAPALISNFAQEKI